MKLNIKSNIDMTLEEAKKILEKEGFKLKGPGKPGVVSGTFAEYESPEVCEAMQVVSFAGFRLAMLAGVFDARKERLKKEYEKYTKAPGSAENRIKEDSGVNPALAEAATRFNDALLDEQAKDLKRLGKEISKLNGIIHKKNLKIDELGKESSRHLEGKMKMFGENFDLEQMLKDKNAVLADVAEELRLSKIREKNLTEVCQKYIKANEDLREKLADKVVDKIDAQALKSAESALAWKEKVIARKDMALAYYEKKISEKDEVIADLGKELKAKKALADHNRKLYDGAKINLNLRMKECEKLKEALDEANKHQQQAYRSCADKNKEIKALKLQISAWEKRGNGIDWKRNADAIKLYVNRASCERLWDPISQEICNEKELSFIINHGGKRMKYALRFDGTDIVYECSCLDKKPSLFRDDSVGAVTNLKDCPIAKDTVDIAEEGGDHSGVIVLRGKDFIDAIKKMK